MAVSQTRYGANLAPGRAPVVSLRGLGVTYPGPPLVEAVRECDLDVHDGEYVVVTGRSGSGKSTLLNVVGLLAHPSHGSYLLEGTDTTLLTDDDVADLRGARLGFVFQAFHLVEHETALVNAALPLVYAGFRSTQRSQRALAALERVGLAERADSVVALLSGGQRQRIAIARAIVNDPALLLCDEPTGNLDTETATSILDVLQDLNRSGTTSMLVTHDPAAASRGTRRVSMRDGVIEEPAA